MQVCVSSMNNDKINLHIPFCNGILEIFSYIDYLFIVTKVREDAEKFLALITYS